MIRFYDFPKRNLKNYHEEDFERKHNKIELTKKNHDILYVLLFICFIVSLTVGYTAMRQEFYVSGNAMFRVEKDIRITNLMYDNENSNNAIDGYHEYSVDNFKSEVILPGLDSKAVYDVTVTNKGTTAMWLKSVVPYNDGTTTYYNNDNIDYIITYEKDGITYEYSDESKPIFYLGTETNIKIIFKYKGGISQLPENTTLTSIIKFEFEEVISVLAKGNDGSVSSVFYNVSPITKGEVENIVFSPVLEISDGALGYWDASLEQDNSVIAYYTDYDLNDKYELTIAGNGVVYSPNDASCLFYNFTNLKSIEFNNYLDVSKASTVLSMFYNCSSLTSLDLSSFDTSNVTNMSRLLDGCKKINSINLANLNTSKVTNMTYLFQSCESLTSLDLSTWNTSVVTQFNNIFNGCKGITEIKLNEQFVTAKATNIKQMFYNCTNLNAIDVSNWDTSNVTNMTSLFYRCYSIKELDVGSWNTTKVSLMTQVFLGCEQITSLDVETKIITKSDGTTYTAWNTSRATDINGMFKNCIMLTTLNVSAWDTTNVKQMSSLFMNCYEINNLDVSNWQTSKVTDMSNMFYRCSSIEYIDVSKWNTSNVTNMNSMFYSYKEDENNNRIPSKLRTLDISKKNITKDDGSTYVAWDTSNVTDMGGMFFYCDSLTELDVSKWNTSNVTIISYMFHGCSKLTELDLSSFDTTNVTNMDSVFLGCASLISLNISDWNTKNVTDMSDMFGNCNKLTELDLSSFDTTNVTDMSDMFSNCSKLTELDVSSFDTTNVTNMDSVFFGCTSLISLNISDWNTTNVTDMSGMFGKCSKLTELDLSSFDTINVTNMDSLFSECTSLISLNISNWNTENVINFSDMLLNVQTDCLIYTNENTSEFILNNVRNDLTNIQII